MSVDPDGNVIVAGTANGPLAAQPLNGATDSFVRKYDTNGTSQWVRLLGAPTTATSANAVTTDFEGNVFAVGTTEGLPGITVTGVSDYWAGKYAPDGTLQ